MTDTTTTITNREAAIAFVAALVPQVPGLTIAPLRGRDSLTLIVDGVPDMHDGIRVRAEVANTGHWYCSPAERQERATRVDHVIITAPGTRLGSYGHVDRNVRFPVRKDKTLNGAGIIETLGVLKEAVQRAHAGRMEQKARELAKEQEKLGTLVALRKDGLLGPEGSIGRFTLHGARGSFNVRGDGKVDLVIQGMSREELTALMAFADVVV